MLRFLWIAYGLTFDMAETLRDYLQVKEDPVFRREGADIHVDTVLSITQVILLILYVGVGGRTFGFDKYRSSASSVHNSVNLSFIFVRSALAWCKQGKIRIYSSRTKSLIASMFFLLVFYQLFDNLASLIRFFALLQAILGGTIQVPTLSGDVVVKVCYMQLIKPITSYKVSMTSIFDIIYCASDFHPSFLCRFALALNLGKRWSWGEKVRVYLDMWFSFPLWLSN